MTKTNKANTTLQNALVFNNRFATRTVNGDQIGIEALDEWKKLLNTLHRECYKVYEFCENNDCRAEDVAVDKTAVFDAIRAIFAYIGNVNNHRLYANDAIAIALIGYSGKRGNKDSAELQFALSTLANDKAQLKKCLELADTVENKEALVAEYTARVEEAEQHKADLLDTADMRIAEPTMSAKATFRREAEHHIARTIVGQRAKSLEQLDAEEAERIARRKARKSK